MASAEMPGTMVKGSGKGGGVTATAAKTRPSPVVPWLHLMSYEYTVGLVWE